MVIYALESSKKTSKVRCLNQGFAPSRSNVATLARWPICTFNKDKIKVSFLDRVESFPRLLRSISRKSNIISSVLLHSKERKGERGMNYGELILHINLEDVVGSFSSCSFRTK